MLLSYSFSPFPLGIIYWKDLPFGNMSRELKIYALGKCLLQVFSIQIRFKNDNSVNLFGSKHNQFCNFLVCIAEISYLFLQIPLSWKIFQYQYFIERSRMVFGQVVIGPPGSGKTTYCNGMSQFLKLIGRLFPFLASSFFISSCIYVRQIIRCDRS